MDVRFDQARSRVENAAELIREKRSDDPRLEYIASETTNPKSTQNKHARRSIETSWSFPSLLNALESGKDLKSKILHAKSLRHSYSMQSHFCHSDAMGLELIRDHAMRGDDERRIKQLNQLSKIWNDLFMLWTLLDYVIEKFVAERDPKKNNEYIEVVEALHAATERLDSLFLSTQTEFYKNISKPQLG